MVVYKCNGANWRDNKDCKEQAEHDLPDNWIELNIESLKNGSEDARMIQAGKHRLHFCSKDCLIGYFFKTVK